jgi:hypothetical protein
MAFWLSVVAETFWTSDAGDLEVCNHKSTYIAVTSSHDADPINPSFWSFCPMLSRPPHNILDISEVGMLHPPDVTTITFILSLETWQ